MERFLQEVRDRYDDRFVIIDSTPSHITNEVYSLSKHVDGIIFVVMANKTPRKEIHKNIEKLGKDKIIGLVFNGYQQERKGYKNLYDKYYKKKP